MIDILLDHSGNGAIYTPAVKRKTQRSAVHDVRGVILEWLPGEGWGVIDTPETPGGCWAHFSAVQMSGYRELRSGQHVRVRWEPAVQDGYSFRGVSVIPLGD